MNDTELLAYGTRELAAFRADLRAKPAYGDKDALRRGPLAKHTLAVLRNAEARRNAAGLTRAQAERACQLAARVQP